MSASRGNTRRQMVPRWRPWRATGLMGELSSGGPARPRPAVERSIATLIRQYEVAPSTGTGGDLLSAAAAYDIRDRAIQDVARDMANSNSGALRDLADWIMENPLAKHAGAFEVKALDSGRRVAKLRAVLNREPRNSVRWVDLAREYLVLGRPGKADRAMTVALDLAGCNRFVLRSAATLYVQLGELDRAVSLLRRCSSVDSDPWVQAPLVAISGLIGQHFSARTAQRMLKDQAPALHLSELAAALGTVELAHGSARRGRQLFRMSVEVPTENALAQAEWLGQQSKASLVERMPSEIPRNFEAVARRAAFEASWSRAISEASSWVADQPFSLEAITFASYCACEGQNFEEALHFTRLGLAIAPDNAPILNNHAFALIGVGKVADLKEAGDTLVRARKANADKYSRATLAATEALWLFRAGAVEPGRRRYKAVIESLERLRYGDEAARAALILASEEAAACTEEADAAWKRAEALVAGSGAPVVRELHERVERERALAGKALPARSAWLASSQLGGSLNLNRLVVMGVEENLSERFGLVRSQRELTSPPVVGIAQDDA